MYRNPVDYALDVTVICAVKSNRELIYLFFVRHGSTCIFGVCRCIYKCYVICVRKWGIEFNIEFCHSVWWNRELFWRSPKLNTVRPFG